MMKNSVMSRFDDKCRVHIGDESRKPLMPTLSLTLIVKNEEIHLPQVLANSKLFADEIVIVDTGSTDRTKEIARQYTEGLIDFEVERTRLSNQIAKLTEEKTRLDGQLSNANFVDRAPIEKVQELRDRQTELSHQIETLNSNLEALD